MSPKSQRLKDLLIIFNLSGSSLSSAVGDNTENLLHFLSHLVALSDVGWWSLWESWPQPETAPAAGSDLCTCSGVGKTSTKWLWSPPGPGHTLVTLPLPLPRLGFSRGKTSRLRTWIHWRLWQGLHWFHTLRLCHALASDTRIINLMFSITSSAIKKGSRRLKDEVPYQQNTRHSTILCARLLLSTPSLWTYRGTPHFAAENMVAV